LPAGASPDVAPFTAHVPRQRLDETNVSMGEIKGPNAGNRRAAALASARMRFDIPAAAPTDRLNRILWHEEKGWNRPYPGVKRALFFPLAVNLEDDEREEREVPKARR